jgi:hypothetical protein
VFIAIAAGAGIVAGRLVRSLSESGADEAGTSGAPTTTVPRMQTNATMPRTGSDTPTFDRVLSETGTEALP